MRHLYEFVNFDASKWLEGKEFEVKGVYDWLDNNRVKIGYRINLCIVRDDCPNYRLKEDEKEFSLRLESVLFKCKECNVVRGDHVQPVGTVGTVWAKDGFLNVSFTCDTFNKLKK